jgi:SAM-dependent methyltransferase
LLRADITKLPFPDNEFDVVISSRVFQYVPDPLLGVSEAYRVLKPGGHAVISVPNKMNIVKYLTYRQAKLYSPFQTRDWFQKGKFKDIEFNSMCFFPSTYGWKRFASYLEVCSNIPLGNLRVVMQLYAQKMMNGQRIAELFRVFEALSMQFSKKNCCMRVSNHGEYVTHR